MFAFTQVILLLLVLVSGHSDEAVAETGVYSISGMESAVPDNDLMPLKSLALGAEVIALGESSHGSEGFHRARYHVLKFMVEKMGVRAIAFEHPWAHTIQAGEFVNTCEGSSLEAVRDFSMYIWKSVANRELLDWLCAFNKEHPRDKVAFFGFDIQKQSVRDFQRVKKTLAMLSEVNTNNITGDISQCFGAQYASDEELSSSQELRNIFGPSPTPTNEIKHQHCLRGIGLARNVLLDYLNREQGSVKIRLALVAANTLEGFENQIYLLSRKHLRESSALRDRLMASTFLDLRSIFAPGKRTAIWAHGYHIAKGFDFYPVPPGFRPNKVMGMYLEDYFGSRYWNMDLWGYEVQVNWPGQEDPSVPTSNEVVTKILHDKGISAAILDSRTSFVKDQKYKTWSDEDPLFDIPKHFDAVLYLDRSPKMVPIK